MRSRTTLPESQLSALDRRLLNDFQRGFPLSPTPYADIAVQLGVTEEQVMERLRALADCGAVSRVGAVMRPRILGASTLAAMAVPRERLDEAARVVNACPEVNHNYEREHDLNLWFVVAADSPERLQQVLDGISEKTGLEVLSFPMLEDYHIDLGFELQWT